MREPFSQFCRNDKGKLDYHELHAIEIGVADGLQPWRSDARAWALHRHDWHYYILARALTTAALAVAATFCAWRCTRGVH